MSKEELNRDQLRGYVNSKNAVAVRDRAEEVLKDVPESFSMIWFRSRMETKKNVDQLTFRFDAYRRERLQLNISKTQREADQTVGNLLKAFVGKHPEFEGTAWDDKTLAALERFIAKGRSTTTVKIYMTNVRTFFNWMLDNDIITKSPFRKYRMPRSNSHWPPFSEEELAIILNLKPKNEWQQWALDWVYLLILSGGSDTRDLVEMRVKQLRSDSFNVVRSKVSKSSGSGDKLVPLSEPVKEIINRLRVNSVKPNDYVFSVMKEGFTEDQNKELLKTHNKRINRHVKEMVEGAGIDFTLKRIRPTVAMIATDAVDVAYAQKILVHANLSQTDTYVKRLPSKKLLAAHTKFEEAVMRILESKTPEPSSTE